MGRLRSGAFFGELAFLYSGGKASASVIAGEPDVIVYVIEGRFINMLFVRRPELAGKFYGYLAQILMFRLCEHGVEMEKQNQLESRRIALERQDIPSKNSKASEIESETMSENDTECSENGMETEKSTRKFQRSQAHRSKSAGQGSIKRWVSTSSLSKTTDNA